MNWKKGCESRAFDNNETANEKTKSITKKHNKIRFMVQLAASKNPIDAKPDNFKGLKTS